MERFNMDWKTEEDEKGFSFIKMKLWNTVKYSYVASLIVLLQFTVTFQEKQ